MLARAPVYAFVCRRMHSYAFVCSRIQSYAVVYRKRSAPLTQIGQHHCHIRRVRASRANWPTRLGPPQWK